MARRTWIHRDGDGERHTIVLEHSYLSGRRRIEVDGRVVVDATDQTNSSGDYELEVGSHPARVRIVQDCFVYRYSLEVDGRVVGGACATERRRPSSDASVSLARVLDAIVPGSGHASYGDFNRGLGWFLLFAVTCALAAAFTWSTQLAWLHASLESTGSAELSSMRSIAPAGLAFVCGLLALVAPGLAVRDVPETRLGSLRGRPREAPRVSYFLRFLVGVVIVTFSAFLAAGSGAILEWLAGTIVAHLIAVTVMACCRPLLGGLAFAAALCVWTSGSLGAMLHGEVLGVARVENVAEAAAATEEEPGALHALPAADLRPLTRRHWGSFIERIRTPRSFRSGSGIDIEHRYYAVPFAPKRWRKDDEIQAWLGVLDIVDTGADSNRRAIAERISENPRGYPISSVFAAPYRRAITDAEERKGLRSSRHAPLLIFDPGPGSAFERRRRFAIACILWANLAWAASVGLAAAGKAGGRASGGHTGSS